MHGRGGRGRREGEERQRLSHVSRQWSQSGRHFWICRSDFSSPDFSELKQRNFKLEAAVQGWETASPNRWWQ